MPFGSYTYSPPLTSVSLSYAHLIGPISKVRLVISIGQMGIWGWRW